jgi:hypothetical protein
MSRRPEKRVRFVTAAVVCGWFLPGVALAIEEPGYGVLERHGSIELRSYDEIVLAETVVDADFDDAGGQAFRRLFGYISGKNRSQVKIDMTAPVVQEATSEKIAMTAPVVQQQDDQGWRVAFVVPGLYTWHNAPEPTDPEVSLRLVPERKMAVLQFSGGWSAERFKAKEAELRASLADRGWAPAGPAVFARYDPPYKPWFLRRNEVMIPVTLEPGIERE